MAEQHALVVHLGLQRAAAGVVPRHSLLQVRERLRELVHVLLELLAQALFRRERGTGSRRRSDLRATVDCSPSSIGSKPAGSAGEVGDAPAAAGARAIRVASLLDAAPSCVVGRRCASARDLAFARSTRGSSKKRPTVCEAFTGIDAKNDDDRRSCLGKRPRRDASPHAMARRARVRASRPSRRVARVLALVVSSRLASASPPVHLFLPSPPSPTPSVSPGSSARSPPRTRRRRATGLRRHRAPRGVAMRQNHRLTRGHRRPPRGVHRRLPDGSNPHPR